MAKRKQIQKIVREGLKDVYDPEIPDLSVIDLGMITKIEVSEKGEVEVTMTPTFAACPAIHFIKKNIQDKLTDLSEENNSITSTSVNVNYDEQWSSDRITEEGRQKLKEFGLTPPPEDKQVAIDEETFANTECPHCGSTDTTLQTPFGSTLCRAIHYCKNCKETFEQFKPVS